MNIKYFILIVGCFISTAILSQRSFQKILIDTIKKTPIEYANILFNPELNLGTISNKEGRFLLPDTYNAADSITISHLGYQSKKIGYNDIIDFDTIFLTERSIDLEEIVIIDYNGLLRSINDSLSSNYYTTPTIDNYFMRYFLKQDTSKIQIIESIISVEKNQYFGRKENRNTKIKIIANLNSRNVKKINKVEFVPFSYKRLFSYSDVQIDFDKNYELTHEQVSKSHIKISFVCTDSLVLSSGPFTGYIIVNTVDKAMEEFYFKKKYKSGSTKKNLKRGFSQEDTFFANKRIWKKDSSNKYRLNLMEFYGQVNVSNIEYDIENTYSYNTVIQLIDHKTIQSAKKNLKVKKRKAINDYKEFNKPLVLKTLNSVLLRTAEQCKIN